MASTCKACAAAGNEIVFEDADDYNAHIQAHQDEEPGDMATLRKAATARKARMPAAAPHRTAPRVSPRKPRKKK